jgi:hypothetical protein
VVALGYLHTWDEVRVSSRLPATITGGYCFCSAGWLKEVYETISGASVGAEILETVKRGGQRCRLEVRLKA